MTRYGYTPMRAFHPSISAFHRQRKFRESLRFRLHVLTVPSLRTETRTRSEASSSIGPCEARRAQQQLEEVVLPLLAPAGLENKGGAGVENRGQWWPGQRYVQRRFFGYT